MEIREKHFKESDITCNSIEELKTEVEKATELIKSRMEILRENIASAPFFYIRNKNNPDDGSVLIYEEYYVVFTNEEKAWKFLESFMDCRQIKDCDIAKICSVQEFLDIMPVAMLGDDLVIKRIEFQDEENCWRCEDIIYDPSSK